MDFSLEENRSALLYGLEEVKKQLGREYDLVIGDRHIRTPKKIVSVNPARPSQVIGIHQRAAEEHAQPAMQVAQEADDTWRRMSAEKRAEFLMRAADAARKRRFEFDASLILEVGKNWLEADADVAEMIDFMEFYAREALRLEAITTPIQFPGERNQLRYVPLGVGAMIRPWNYPFAISKQLMRPSSQPSVIR